MTAPQESRPRQLGRFSQDASNALELAKHEARKLGQNHVGTEHILLALTLSGNATFTRPNEALENHGVTHDRVRKEVLPRGLVKSGFFTGEIDLAPRARKIVEEGAPAKANQRKSPTVDIEDLIDALKEEKEAAAAKILQDIAPEF